MKSEITLADICKWLLEGKKIRKKTWGKDSFVWLVEGNLVDEYESYASHSFSSPLHWELYETPVEWFEVIYSLKNGNTRPTFSSNLYRSKADFLNWSQRKEEEFEFIKLRKVEL